MAVQPPRSQGEVNVEYRVVFERLVIQRGCLLHGVDLSKAPHGWWVALASDSLSTDLSGSSLIMDEPLQQSLDWVIGQILHVHRRMAG